jgi:uncharacterized protein YneF (UPF0154 family)
MPNLGQMTTEHVLYIPVVLLAGILIGYTLGARAVRGELERHKQRMKE